MNILINYGSLLHVVYSGTQADGAASLWKITSYHGKWKDYGEPCFDS